MKFSEAWLREWVNPDLDRDALLEQLTMAGLEVEGAEPVAPPLAGVVVARIEACEPHPDADKLSLCRVDDGDTVHDVVCGAPNARAGLVTAFARVGTKLPGGLKIRASKIRGVKSHGMLCSGEELGLGDDSDGIVELEMADVRLGTPLGEALALDDVSIEVDLTPNRGDCLSLRGLAREVGVLNDLRVEEPAVNVQPATHDEVVSVALDDSSGCPRYLGRVISGVDVTRPSPQWLAERLRRCGLRSIDPVVDVTNFVLLELGQPMHAFDRATLESGIIVRRAREAEQLTILDGTELELCAEDLLICDGDQAIALAGVMGGQRTGVSADTRDVFLECAYFEPLTIAATARRYGLHTDASHRYERGVDFELQARAMERATELLLDIVGGAAGPVTEALDAAALPERRDVSLRASRLKRLAGTDIEEADVDRAFALLDFEVVTKSGQGDTAVWTVRAPSHRFDIAIEADLVEEVCRIYGYNRIPARMPEGALTLRDVALERRGELALKHRVAALGYHEAVTYSFVDPALVDRLDPGAQPLALANPMSSEQSVMRTNLLPGLLEALAYNIARQQPLVRLFELGLCFEPREGALNQRQRLGGVVWGPRSPENWASDAVPVDFFDLKGDVEQLLGWAGLDDVSFRAENHPVLHPGQAAAIDRGGRTIGWLGRVHPEVQEACGLREQTFAFEIDADVLLMRPRREMRPVSKFPSVRRDLAVLVDRDVSAHRLRDAVSKAAGERLIEFRLFDVYEGKGIDSNKKSVAMGLTFQDASATLTDRDVNDLVQQVVAALERDTGAELR